MKKVTVITGHYGSGKTNLSVNLAVKLAGEGKKVTVIDFDMVNPYFRTADFKTMFSDINVDLISSVYANSNLDMPAVTFDVHSICRDDGYVIIDVGGDDAGAAALGGFKALFEELKAADEIDMFYVINQRRYLTKTPQEALELMYEIESAIRFKHTGIVNNTNLGCETTAQTVLQSLDFAKSVSEAAGLPIVMTSVPEGEISAVDTADRSSNFTPVKAYVKPLWEQ
ncbi:MAG: AAA family ATPase [Oscillospiraceae bacterium]